MTSSRRRCLLVALIAGSLCLGVVPGAAQAADDAAVVINEVYARGGSANQPYSNKYVELYNPTSAAVQLSGMSLQYRSASGTGTANGTAALSGTVEPGAYFVVQLPSNGGTGEALPQVDLATTSLNPSGTNGTIYLVAGPEAVAADDASVVDKVGYGSSNSPETSAVTYTGSNSTPGSIGRVETGVDTGDNFADFAFFETPTPGGPNGGGTVDPPPLEEVSIAEIQGPGSASPLTGQTVTTQGVVTAVYATGGFNGFYLQTPGSGGSQQSETDASVGLFAYGDTDVAVGECVNVTGKVVEYNSLTEINASTVEQVTGCEPVTPTELASLPESDAGREAYEGMLILPQGTYTITNNYGLNSYGQLGLVAGEEALRVATDVVGPEEAADYEAAQAAKMITLDDGSSWNYLTNSTAKFQPLPYLSQETPMRTGSQLSFKEPVILDYRFQWNFQPAAQVTGSTATFLTAENDRPTSAPEVAGNIKLASFNVLNYFTDLGEDEPDCAGYTDIYGNPVASNYCEVRGAYTESAFEDQQAKIVAAINQLDADVVSLMEVENSAGLTWIGHARDDSLAKLVSALNAAGGNWDYVPSPLVTPTNEDVIRTAFIYNPDTVRPKDASLILLDDAFANARYPLAQEFQVKKSGTKFVAIANHFKSKGSGEDDGTGQGLSNPSREAQATALTDWANSEFRNQAVFLLGDFNAYSAETPVQLIEGAGFTNAVAKYAAGATTYQYGGRLGSLDHIFGNKLAMKLVADADVWKINSEESVAMQYSRRNYNITDFYTAQPWAASDHDPAVVGINAKKDAHGNQKPKKSKQPRKCHGHRYSMA